VPDEIWDEAARHYDEPALAALIISIALINFWNRLNVPTRQVEEVTENTMNREEGRWTQDCSAGSF
jgi:hypothetical protein